MTAFLLYSALFIGLALAESRGRLTAEGYFLFGRRAGALETGASAAASCVGASATIGMCGLAFSAGLPAAWWILSGAAGLWVFSRLALKRLRVQGAGSLTLLEAVRPLIGAPAARIACAVILAAWTAILAAQFAAMGRVAAGMTGLDDGPALLLGAGVIVLYTLLGGQGAVMRSDVVQLGVMTAGLAALLAHLALWDPAPLSAMPLELLNDVFTLSDWSKFMLFVGGSYVVCPMLAARFMSARSASAARSGAWIGIALLVLLALVITLIGVEARAFLPAEARGDDVLPSLAASMPAWAGLAFFFVMASAVLSSADSCLLTAASVAANDLCGRPSIALARAWMLVLSAAALWLASSGRTVLELLLAANAVYVCAVVPPAFAALAAGRRLHSGLAAAVMTAAGALALASEAFGDDRLAYAALAGSIIGSAAALALAPASEEGAGGASAAQAE